MLLLLLLLLLARLLSAKADGRSAGAGRRLDECIYWLGVCRALAGAA
jgi:hypothetical protein